MDINLITLTNAQGFRILGENTNDESGLSVSGAGDVNKDGYADVIIGAYKAANNAGKSYLLFGKASGFNDINLSALTSAQGFRILGETSGDLSGSSVSSAGDVNNDGYSDLIIGASSATNGAGKSYVLFGKATGFSDINLSTLTSSQGFRILGEASGDYSGYRVCNAGDVNKDGFGDVIIGAYGAKSTAGISYVIFGKASGFSDISLSALTSAQGFKIFGEASGDLSGRVSSAGDVNKDGYADLIIGAYAATNYTGKTYVIFGKASGFSDINLSTLTSAQGFRILGETSNDESGVSVSSAGDVNKDGYADVIIGADQYIKHGAGKSYIIFGKATGFTDINLSTLTSAQGFRILGENANDYSGYSVSSGGDINKDGYSDIIIGAFDATNNAGVGKSYVIFGKANGFSDINLSTLTSNQGFRILGENANDYSGYSVSDAGDINKDGYSDVIIGAYGASSFAGKSYVLFAMIPLQVTANNITAIYEANIPELTISYSGFINSEDPSSLIVQPTATTTAVPASTPGIYPITVSGGVSSHYYFNYVDGYLTIKEDSGSSDFNLLDNFIKIGIPILSGIAAVISIIYTLNKCKNEGMCCFKKAPGPTLATALMLNSASYADAASTEQINVMPEDNIIYYDQANENNEVLQIIDY